MKNGSQYLPSNVPMNFSANVVIGVLSGDGDGGGGGDVDVAAEFMQTRA